MHRSDQIDDNNKNVDEIKMDDENAKTEVEKSQDATTTRRVGRQRSKRLSRGASRRGAMQMEAKQQQKQHEDELNHSDVFNNNDNEDTLEMERSKEIDSFQLGGDEVERSPTSDSEDNNNGGTTRRRGRSRSSRRITRDDKTRDDDGCGYNMMETKNSADEGQEGHNKLEEGNNRPRRGRSRSRSRISRREIDDDTTKNNSGDGDESGDSVDLKTDTEVEGTKPEGESGGRRRGRSRSSRRIVNDYNDETTEVTTEVTKNHSDDVPGENNTTRNKSEERDSPRLARGRSRSRMSNEDGTGENTRDTARNNSRNNSEERDGPRLARGRSRSRISRRQVGDETASDDGTSGDNMRDTTSNISEERDGPRLARGRSRSRISRRQVAGDDDKTRDDDGCGYNSMMDMKNNATDEVVDAPKPGRRRGRSRSSCRIVTEDTNNHGGGGGGNENRDTKNKTDDLDSAASEVEEGESGVRSRGRGRSRVSRRFISDDTKNDNGGDGCAAENTVDTKNEEEEVEDVAEPEEENNIRPARGRRLSRNVRRVRQRSFNCPRELRNTGQGGEGKDSAAADGGNNRRALLGQSSRGLDRRGASMRNLLTRGESRRGRTSMLQESKTSGGRANSVDRGSSRSLCSNPGGRIPPPGRGLDGRGGTSMRNLLTRGESRRGRTSFLLENKGASRACSVDRGSSVRNLYSNLQRGESRRGRAAFLSDDDDNNERTRSISPTPKTDLSSAVSRRSLVRLESRRGRAALHKENSTSKLHDSIKLIGDAGNFLDPSAAVSKHRLLDEKNKSDDDNSSKTSDTDAESFVDFGENSSSNKQKAKKMDAMEAFFSQVSKMEEKIRGSAAVLVPLSMSKGDCLADDEKPIMEAVSKVLAWQRVTEKDGGISFIETVRNCLNDQKDGKTVMRRRANNKATTEVGMKWVLMRQRIAKMKLGK